MSEITNLVVVSTEYPDWSRPPETRDESFWQGSEEERTFYAYRNGDYYWRLVAPADGCEPRSRGFYYVTGDPEGHHGWNVEPQYITTVFELEAPEESPTAPKEAPVVTFGELGIGEAFRTENSDPDTTVWWVKTGEGTYVSPATDSGHGFHHESLSNDFRVRRVQYGRTDIPTSAPVTDSTVTTEREEEIRRDQRNKDLAQFKEWKDEATRIAHEYAAANGLCSEFDRAMRDIGLPDRSEYTPPENEYRVTLTFNVSAPDGDEAWERVYGTLDTDTGYTLVFGTPSNQSISRVRYDVETVD